MMHARFNTVFFVIFLLFILAQGIQIPLNSDDYWVFNIVRDMAEKPSYYSLSGSGYRVFHKLLYLPLFAVFGFDINRSSPFIAIESTLFTFLLVCVSAAIAQQFYGYLAALATFVFLATSNMLIYNTWYWSSTHLNIGTLFLTLHVWFLLRQQNSHASIAGSAAIFTRESLGIPILFLFAYTVFHRHLWKRPASFVLALPLIFYAAYTAANLLFLGSFSNPLYGNLVTIHPLEIFDNIHVLWTDYLSYTIWSFILFPTIIGVFLLLKHRIGIEERTLLVWIIGVVTSLVLVTHQDPRYLIPMLPPLSILTAGGAAYLFQKKKAYITTFLTGSMAFAAFLFSIPFIASMGSKTLSVLANAFFLILLSAAVIVGMMPKKSLLLTIFLFTLALSILIQVSQSYNFFVWHGDHARTSNSEVQWITQNAPPNLSIAINPLNPITIPDTPWFHAYKRYDIHHYYPKDQHNITRGMWIITTPNSWIDKDILGQLVEKQPERFRLLQSFGSACKRQPVIRIPKTVRQAFKNIQKGYLFHIEQAPGYRAFVYEVKS